MHLFVLCHRPVFLISVGKPDQHDVQSLLSHCLSPLRALFCKISFNSHYRHRLRKLSSAPSLSMSLTELGGIQKPATINDHMPASHVLVLGGRDDSLRIVDRVTGTRGRNGPLLAVHTAVDLLCGVDDAHATRKVPRTHAVDAHAEVAARKLGREHVGECERCCL